MKTFILTESPMNGTVTVDTFVTIFQSDNFEKVVNHIKNNLKELKHVVYYNDDDKELSYSIQNQTFPVFGHIYNKEATFVNV